MSQTPGRFVPPPAEAPVRGHIRARGFDRVSHGLFLPDAGAHGDPDRSWLRELDAWLAVLPGSAVFTHVTAARLYGWDLPRLPDQVPVFAAVGSTERRPRRDGLVCSRLTRATSGALRAGMPVDDPAEVLLRAARDLGVLDLVVLIDSARRCGDVDAPAIEAILASGRPGVAVLRAAWELSSPHHESPGESVMSVFLAAMDVVADPQVEVYGEGGVLLGRADFLVRDTRLVYEYDGSVHRDPLVHRRDLRRERGWATGEYARRGFVLDDLLNHPGVVMHEIDRDLRRPHVSARLRRWRTLVEQSMYDDTGRRRVLNRWRRQMGIVQWR